MKLNNTKIRIAVIAALLPSAAVLSGCDRFNDTRIFVTFRAPSARSQLQDEFIEVMARYRATCWETAEDAGAFREFDKTAWSFIACGVPGLRIFVDFGSSDRSAFASLTLTSSGFRSEPEMFGNLRSDIASAFVAVVGADSVEVVDGTARGYTETLHEAVERRRVEQTPNSPPALESSEVH